MKSSEALLRAIANEGGRITSYQFDEWLGQLVNASLLEKVADETGFYYKLTPAAETLLKNKNVNVGEDLR